MARPAPRDDEEAGLLVQIHAAAAEVDGGIAAAGAAVPVQEAVAAQPSPAVEAVQLPGRPDGLRTRRQVLENSRNGSDHISAQLSRPEATQNSCFWTWMTV